MAEADVRLVHVSKRFAGAAAVDDVSLDIPAASFTTLLGPSGCGKTTTLRMIAGFYDPDAGDIFIGPRRINDVPAHRRKTAMVFQDYALFPHMSVADNVGYGPRITGLQGVPLDNRVRETLDFLGLTGLERRYPNQLSGGQQQRVALARALVMNPAVLLLDEPLSNLDAKLRVSIRAELNSIQRQLGITTIYVTHDQDEALAMSDWLAVMDHGRVVQWGTPWEVYYRPRTPFMADFLGSVNLIPAPIVRTNGHQLRVSLAGQEFELRTEVGATGQTEALLCIRPETLRLANGTAEASGRAEAAEASEDRVALPGTVVRRTFLGHLMRYTVRVEQHDWLVDQPDPGSAGLAEGAVVVLVNPRRVHVIPGADRMKRDLLGEAAQAWVALGVGLPPGSLRLVLADVDGVITRGEAQPVELEVLERLGEINRIARRDPSMPAITLCTGRQAPYVELMAQLTDVFLPCIFEHGAGLFFPTAFRYEFDPWLGPDYSARLARLRAALDEPLLTSGRAFVQPGKEATMTLYPLGETHLDELFARTEAVVASVAPGFDVARNVRGVEVRPRGIDKGRGAQRIAELLEIPLGMMAGVGDSDPDLSFLDGIGLGFSAAPANATPNVRQAVRYVARAPFGAGLLEIVALAEAHNRKQTLTET